MIWITVFFNLSGSATLLPVVRKTSSGIRYRYASFNFFVVQMLQLSENSCSASSCDALVQLRESSASGKSDVALLHIFKSVPCSATGSRQKVYNIPKVSKKRQKLHKILGKYRIITK